MELSENGQEKSGIKSTLLGNDSVKKSNNFRRHFVDFDIFCGTMYSSSMKLGFEHP